VLALGLLSCLLLPRGALRWFGVLVLAVPFFGAFVFFPFTRTMRGYLTYGVSIWVYCWLGRSLAVGLRGHAWLRITAGLALLIALGTHFAWSTAHFWGWLGPVKVYFGKDYGSPHLVHLRPLALSMTGWERTPVLFGGEASLDAAGASISDPEMVIDPAFVSWLQALATRAPLLGYVALFGIVAVPSTRRRLLVAAVMAGLTVVSAGLSALTFRAVPNLVPIYARFTLPHEGTFTYQVELSQAFRDTLRKARQPQDGLCFFIGIPYSNADCSSDAALVQISVAADPLPIPIESVDGVCLPLDPPSALAALSEAGHITVAVTNRLGGALPVYAWQRRDLPGRRLVLTPAAGTDIETPECLPVVEIRLLRPDGSIKLAGF
jgi:hypothetical protein